MILVVFPRIITLTFLNALVKKVHMFGTYIAREVNQMSKEDLFEKNLS